MLNLATGLRKNEVGQWPSDVMGDTEPPPERPLLIREALFRVPEPTVVIETVNAERRDVRRVSRIVLERHPLIQSRNIMDGMPPNLGRPFQSKAPCERRRLA
jgi:hypothetical protein